MTDRTVYRVNPDAYFSVRDEAGAIRNYYLEFDGGTEEQRRILAKFNAYWWWLQAPAYRDSVEESSRVSVLFVTTGHRRMENMMRTLKAMRKPNSPDSGGKGWFRFCLDTDYAIDAPHSVLTPIWRTVAGREDLKALL